MDGGGVGADGPRLRGSPARLKEEGKYSDGVAQAERVYYAGPPRQEALGRLRQRPAHGRQRRAVRRGDGADRQPDRGAGPGGDGGRRPRGRTGPRVRRAGLGGAPGGRRELAHAAHRDVHGQGATGRSCRPRTTADLAGVNVPPPVPVPPPTLMGDQTEVELQGPQGAALDAEEEEAARLPGWVGAVADATSADPLLAALLVTAGVVVAKLARRGHRRRSRATVGPHRRCLARAGRPRPRPGPARARRARWSPAVSSRCGVRLRLRGRRWPDEPTPTCSARVPPLPDVASVVLVPRSTPSAGRCRPRSVAGNGSGRRSACGRSAAPRGPTPALIRGFPRARPRLVRRPNVGLRFVVPRGCPDHTRPLVTRGSSCARG